MPSRRQRTRKFWKNVLTMFVIYLFLAAGIYLLLDYNSASRHFREDPAEFVLIIIGVAFAAAFCIANWLLRYPELRQW